jgi:hypothetical protein
VTTSKSTPLARNLSVRIRSQSIKRAEDDKFYRAVCSLFGHICKEVYPTDQGFLETRADLFRALLARETEAFQHAPYRSEPSQFFALVRSDGSILSVYRQRLHFNSGTYHLPLSLSFSEKKRSNLSKFLESSGEPPFGESFKDHWLMNIFSAWHRGNSADNPLFTDSRLRFDSKPDTSRGDSKGVSRKHVRLEIDANEGDVVDVERIKLVKDHALRKTSKLRNSPDSSTDDHVDFDITVPSLRSTFLIAVDPAIYSAPFQSTAEVDFSLRLVDGPGWKANSETNAMTASWRNGRRVNGHLSGDPSQPELQSIVTEMEQICHEVRLRASHHLTSDVGQGQQNSQALSAAVDESLISNLCLPSNIVFGKLDWPIPPLGFQVSLSWDVSDIASEYPEA